MKKYLFGAFAIAFAFIAATAFTERSDNKNINDGWFVYDGSGPLFDVSSYPSSQPTDPCTGGVDLCAIHVGEDETLADKLNDQAFQQRIQAAISAGTSNTDPEVKLEP